MDNSSKKQYILKLISIISLISSLFIVSIARAAEPENYVKNDTTMTIHESNNNSVQKSDILQEQIDFITPPKTSEVCISLNDKLRWFFSLEKPDFIKDLYENQFDFNYRATIGFHIAL